jgi:CubicO group peptidase (beta-lactamase class C family)
MVEARSARSRKEIMMFISKESSGAGSAGNGDGPGLDRRDLLRRSAAAAAAPAALSVAGLSQRAAAAVEPGTAVARRQARTMSDGGLSAARLERMSEVMSGYVERGVVPGLVTLVSRRGEHVLEAIGRQEFDGSAPMARDTIFRIASVTKPITAAAAMILVEECVLRLDDPVDALLPELADRQVLRTIESELDDTVPAERPITLRDLLTFRLGYGALFAQEQYPIQQAFQEAGIAPGPMLPALGPDELMAAYGSLPLFYQPGERWLYNSGADILGVLIARASGQTLGEFLQERIFEPLGMKDTGFSVPENKLDRLAGIYWTNFETGEFEPFDGVADSRFAVPPVFESGAGGLVSTADDLLAFAEMMQNNGKFGNERILSRPSVELMTSDQLQPAQKVDSDFFPGFWESNGWGFGVAVTTKRIDLSTTPGRYGWDGGYGTSWYVDPAEGMIGILLTQRVWDGPEILALYADYWTSAYQAIDD